MKKMTKREYFATIRSYIESSADSKIGSVPVDEVLGFIDHELELLAKKNASDRKPTAQQTANESIKTAILDGMTPNRMYTITEIQKEIPGCADLSNQKISALIRQLKDAGLVVKTEDKRKSYFSLAE
jgi:predicted transcriptional regulator